MKRNQLVLGDKDHKSITDDICSPVESIPGKGWLALFMGAQGLLIFYLIILGTVISQGMGLLGVNSPNAWGTMIITFVFWIGIGHAGTLISAILFFVPAKVANISGSNGRGHDRFCGDDRGSLSASAHGSTLA